MTPARQETGATGMTTDRGDSLRLFTAIDLPEGVCQSLVGLCHGIPGVRWVKPEQLHLTLRFIGAVNREQFATIREVLATIEAPPVILTMKGVGSFPPSGQPRVLWAGLEPSGILTSLRNRIEELLIAAGCEPEKRSFSPHITLARLRDIPRNLVAPYLMRHASFTEGPFEVKEFCLYSSVLTRQGSIHRIEQRNPLTAGAEVGG